MIKYARLVMPALFAGVLIITAACTKSYTSAVEQDTSAIESYIHQNGGNYTKDTAGYYYSITAPGAGTHVKYSDSVFYNLTLSNLSGQARLQWANYNYRADLAGYTDRFNESKTGITYSLTTIRDVIGRLNYGGSAKVVIPSYKAFGKNGVKSWSIGANENLVADITLMPYKHHHQVDSALITRYIAEKGLTMLKDKYGIYYQVLTAGDAAAPITSLSTITATYSLYNLAGVLQEETTTASEFALSNSVIAGWRLGIPGKVGKGGKLRLIIPSALGYGNGVLDFTITISDVSG